MPLIFPGSSEQLIPAPLPAAPVEPAPEVRDKLEALSADEPLPEVYPGDRARLLMQSPYRLYLYWNHASDPFAALRRAFGAEFASQYTLALRLLDMASGDEQFFAAPPARNYWFNVRPGRKYQAHVGLLAPGRPFIRLLSSGVVSTPRVSVSPTPAPEPEFRASAAEFARVLNETGYATDALEVTLEAADEATHDGATRGLVAALVGEKTPSPVGGVDDQMREMRALLAALAFGVSPERLLPLLSPALAAWLARVLEEHREAARPARLLELLRAALALELDYEEHAGPDDEDRMRRPARFVWGASDVQVPTRLPRLWMPSMSEEITTRLESWQKQQRSEAGG